MASHVLHDSVVETKVNDENIPTGSHGNTTVTINSRTIASPKFYLNLEKTIDLFKRNYKSSTDTYSMFKENIFSNHNR